MYPYNPAGNPYNPSAPAGAHMYPPGVMLPPHLQQQPQYYPQSPYPGAYRGAYPGAYPGAYTQPHHMTRPASPYGKRKSYLRGLNSLCYS